MLEKIKEEAQKLFPTYEKYDNRYLQNGVALMYRQTFIQGAVFLLEIMESEKTAGAPVAEPEEKKKGKK